MDFSSWIRRRLLRNPEKTEIPDQPKQSNQTQAGDELLGVTQPLIDHIQTFTVDTFKNFRLQDDNGVTDADATPTNSSANLRQDLSEWQQRHATLVLSRVKELSQLRFMLCPRHLKERQFWRIYFMLVKSHIAKYELSAVQLAKLKKMETENDEPQHFSVYEVEMAETKQVASLSPSTP
ncbi:hypothetical protein HS088_TW10G00258 [Tripterygium wilfordii]|uniref:BSD domain-containing protein n=1 Tax=Tripterygium wilfordii TaxID=458696 RepID=A0A7J7D4J8_TRIWF|nr:uncharacterized protein LOC120007680 [Tripterygium wilfordii]XP_038714000.1 uncharacterized protein LOC120007680 [Tripterygium wilfordii]KAF5741262.1 hypothetical protein HS088_TW10G00258 [Tripterygium wilfordii]